MPLTKNYGLERYHYKPGPTVFTFVGGFFDKNTGTSYAISKNIPACTQSQNRRKNMSTSRAIGAIKPSVHGNANKKNPQKLQKRTHKVQCSAENVSELCAWDTPVYVRFHSMADEDSTNAKLVLLALEKSGRMAGADDLDEPLQRLETHMMSQVMKEVATLSESNANKRENSGKGGNPDGKSVLLECGVHYGGVYSASGRSGAV